MGQKVHPIGFRLGFNKTWRSRWYADKDYSKLLHEDIKLRDTLKTRFMHAGVSKIEIERAANKLKIDIYTSRPGIIIMRKAVESALRFGARGIKVRVSGRLNGAEIARSEWYLHGQLPLQTLRADIDYGFAEANTTYGQIGIKVWLYKGERLVPQRGREEEYRERGPRRPADARR